MAKPSPELKRFLRISKTLSDGQVPNDVDLQFYVSFLPQINQEVLDEANKLIQEGEVKGIPPNLSAEHYLEMGRAQLQNPMYRDQLLRQAEQIESDQLANDFNGGLNIILGGLDIANSVRQIRAGEQQARRSKRPQKPAVPQRDVYLQAALRNAEEGTFDAARALAPIQADIYDQYLNDVNDAKIASGGQLGAYGAYRQLASDRKNRAAMQMAPIVDDIRRGQQARYDNLLGMRLDENQKRFQNQASLYPYELDQYNQDQQTAAALSSTGRRNLRNSMYNLAPQFGDSLASNRTRRKYDRLRSQMSMYGDDVADMVVKSNQKLDQYNNGWISQDDDPAYFQSQWEQMYGL